MNPRGGNLGALNRRRFLGLASRAGLAAAACCSLGVPLLAARRREKALFMIRLAGGFDGLDFLAPLADADYRRLRPRLADDPSTFLPLSKSLGMKPDCRFFHEQFRQGALSIVQGVGTSVPVLSHERAREAWRLEWDSATGGGREAESSDLAGTFRSLVGRPSEFFPSVVWLSFGDFDSHANQRARSAGLRSELSRQTEALLAAVDEEGLSARVLLVFYSEFGRSAGENAFGGTDHGNAAPVLVLGKSVKGGLYGEAPRLCGLRRASPLAATVDRSALLRVLSERWLERPWRNRPAAASPSLSFI